MSACAQDVERSVSTTGDLFGLVEHLEASERFHQDTLVGRIVHPGTISFRERVRENSVHILIVGNRVSAHVDRYAPLRTTRSGDVRYSVWRVAVHNLAHIAEDVVRRMAGRGGEHRCVLDCERIEVDDEMLDALLTEVTPSEGGCGVR